jgi:hypothetical protein
MSTDLAVLTRILAPSDFEGATAMLDERTLATFALHALVVEEAFRSELLAKVPASREENHALSDAIAVSVRTVKELEALRTARVAPLNAEVKRVNALFQKLTGPLQVFREKGDRLYSAFMSADRAKVAREQEEARRRVEAAARAEAEALAKAEAATSEKARQRALAEAETASRAQAAVVATAPLDAPKKYRSDEGTVASREVWLVLSISYPDQVPAIYRHDPAVLEALRKVLQKAVTAGAREILGVVIGGEDRTRVTA